MTSSLLLLSGCNWFDGCKKDEAPTFPQTPSEPGYHHQEKASDTHIGMENDITMSDDLPPFTMNAEGRVECTEKIVEGPPY